MTGALELRLAGPADGAALWDILLPAFRAGDSYAVDRDISQSAALVPFDRRPLDKPPHLESRVRTATDEEGAARQHQADRRALRRAPGDAQRAPR